MSQQPHRAGAGLALGLAALASTGALLLRERRRSAALRTLADRLTATWESVDDAVIVVDQAWVIEMVNPHAETFLRRSRDELVGLDVWTAFPAGAGVLFEKSLREARSTGRPVRFDGRSPTYGVWVEVSVYPYQGHLTIYVRDVSEHRLLAERVAHVERLESLGRFTGGVAHDFNNVLAVVMGNADVLAARLGPDSPLEPLASRVSRAAQRGADLTHSLLAFARNQPLDPEEIDLADLVRDTTELLERTLGDDVTVVTDLAPGAAPCLVDRVQLQNALLNLCVNARDAMPDGGSLTLSTTEVVLGEEDAGRSPDTPAGPYAVLAVRDEGTGIAPEDLDRVFEPFFTTKGARGTGLGLATVYGFVKQSHGDVLLESQPGAGTTVSLLLPSLASVPSGVAFR